MFSTPAVIVVTVRNASGTNVTSAYGAGRWRRMNEVPTARAITARSWFETPNRGQIVSMLPVTAR